MSTVSKKQNHTSKYIEGKLAVCSFCGMSAADFNYCLRCKRKLPKNVTAIPISSDTLPKKENTIPVDGRIAAVSKKHNRTPKYIEGKLAVCPMCGMRGADFNYCLRCKRKLPENVKAIPISSGTLPKKKNTIPVDVYYKRKRKEPECSTISSAKDDDNRKQKRDTHTVDATIVQKQITGSEAKIPLILENAEELPTRLNQLNCTLKSEVKSEPEEHSSGSLAYLQQEIDDPEAAIVQKQITGSEAKMLVILENGKQRLITFEVPKEDCTVQDLLEQANIFSSQKPEVSLVSDPTVGINYIVDVTASRSISHKVTKKKILKGHMSNETANVVNTVEPKTLINSEPHIAQPRANSLTNNVTLHEAEKNAVSTRGRKSRGRRQVKTNNVTLHEAEKNAVSTRGRKSRGRRQVKERMSAVSKNQNRTPKYIEGMMAACSFCGMSSYDFNYCMQCNKELPQYVKPIPISAGVLPTKENTVPVETLYETNKAALTHKSEKDTVAKRSRGRGGRVSVGTRQIKDSECLIISDEEDNGRTQKRLKIND